MARNWLSSRLQDAKWTRIISKTSSSHKNYKLEEHAFPLVDDPTQLCVQWPCCWGKGALLLLLPLMPDSSQKG